MRTYLSNPTKVKDAYVAEPVLRPVAGTTHYITCVRYNPRDGANQYLGNQTNLGIFLGGELTQFLPADPQMCARLGLSALPRNRIDGALTVRRASRASRCDSGRTGTLCHRAR